MVSTRFPTPLAVDPWWDVYLPATFGEVAAATAAAAALLPHAAAQAVLVRTWAVLGRAAEADRLWRSWRTAPDPEIAVLGVVLEDQPDRWVERVERFGGSPGRVVDAWCDRAARALVDGDLAAARRWVRQATDAPLDHAEAGHWARFVVEVEDPVEVYHQAVGGRPVSPGVDALVLRAANGWVSPERLRRRHLAAPDLPVPAGSALALLLAAGVNPEVFGDPRSFARLHPGDPRVDLEQTADLVRSLVAEGRDVADLAAGLLARGWAAGEGIGAVAAAFLADTVSGGTAGRRGRGARRAQSGSVGVPSSG